MAKFITPNIIGCLLWPPFYFLPGILAGAAIDIPAGMQSGEFKWLLLATAVFLWVGGWLCWRLWRSGKATDRLSHYLSRGRLLWLTPLICHRRGGAGGVNSPSVNAGVYRYFA